MSDYSNKVVDLETDKGTITLAFYPDKAPNHVRNFIDLAKSGFYDGTRFHRVIAGFMIQGGDPKTKDMSARSMWGTGGASNQIKAEFNAVHHRRGILSMARSNSPDSASSQFFVTVADAPFLNNQYTVFGEVLSGMDAADAIVAAAGGRENPAEPVVLKRAVVRDAKAGEKPSGK